MELNNKRNKRAAHNERFGVMAAVSPQKVQYELATACPAGSSVEAATTPSRHHVGCNAGRQCDWEQTEKNKANLRIIFVIL